MKYALFLSLLAIYTALAQAQISLEYSYPYSASVSELSDGEYSYFLMDVAQEQCRLYSKNHELSKTINLPVPANYYVSDIKFVSRYLFNTDDLIELLCIYEKYVPTGTSYYIQYSLDIINENGTKLLNLPNGGWAEIKNMDAENKLLAYSYIYNPGGYYDVQTNVYKIEGSTSVSNIPGELINPAYPNPADNWLFINLESVPEALGGQFELYNLNGQKVHTSGINSTDKFSIYTGNLSAGPYFYIIKNKNQSIRTEKIIIR